MSNSKKNRERVRNFTNLTEYETNSNKVGDIRVFDFEDNEIRAIYHLKEWHFSVVDITAALTESTNPNNYWAKTKQRLILEGANQSVTNCHKLKLPSSDGKSYLTDCAAPNDLFRIIQSIPSQKAEPFKRWFAEVAYERLKEEAEPSIAIDRAIGKYRSKGRTDDWIDHRLQSISARNDITDEWEKRNVSGKSYRHITNAMSDEALGIRPKQHEELKGLRKSDNLRDHMTNTELAITALGERAATEIIRKRNTQGYKKTKEASVDGAKVAGIARQELEKQLGRTVVSENNFLDQKNSKFINKNK